MTAVVLIVAVVAFAWLHLFVEHLIRREERFRAAMIAKRDANKAGQQALGMVIAMDIAGRRGVLEPGDPEPWDGGPRMKWARVKQMVREVTGGAR